MFNKGDYVVNAINGICKIEDIVEMDMLGNNQVKSYYFLIPVSEQTAKVYIPVDNAAARIRAVIDEQIADEILSDILNVPELEIPSEKERELMYKNAIKSCEPRQLVSLIKCINKRKRERLELGKKCTAVDERYYKNAENNLCSELAFVKGKEKAQISNEILHILEQM